MARAGVGASAGARDSGFPRISFHWTYEQLKCHKRAYTMRSEMHEVDFPSSLSQSPANDMYTVRFAVARNLLSKTTDLFPIRSASRKKAERHAYAIRSEPRIMHSPGHW